MNIYVGNLSYETAENDLTGLFEQFGTVSKVSVIRDRDSGRSKGFGFVEMEDAAAAEKAIGELDGTAVKDRNIKVNEARPREERPKPRRRNW